MAKKKKKDTVPVETITLKDLQEKMNATSFEQFQQCGTDYNANFLDMGGSMLDMGNGAINSVTGIMDSATSMAMGAVDNTIGSAMNMVSDVSGAALGGVTALSNNLQNNAAFVQELIMVAMQDMTMRVEQRITSAIAEMSTPPNMGMVMSSKGEYLSQLIPSSSDVMKTILMKRELLNKLRADQIVSDAIGSAVGVVNDSIGKVNEKVGQYIQKYQETIQMVTDCIDRGPAYVAEQIGQGERKVLSAIDCTLYGGDPNEEIVNSKKKENVSKLENKIEKLKEKLAEVESKLSKITDTTTPKYRKLLTQKCVLQQKIGNLNKRTNELNGKEQEENTKDPIEEKINELKGQIGGLEEINDKANVIRQIIALETKRDSQGIVGTVNAKKEQMVKLIGLKMAVKEATVVKENLEKVQQKLNKKIEKLQKKAEAKVEQAKSAAIIQVKIMLS